MPEEIIKEYYKLMNTFKVSIWAAKWLNINKNVDNEALITLNEFLYRELLKFGINNIGLTED